MKKSIYSVRDNIAETFAAPFLSINDSTAKRDFIDGVASSPHKDDLVLFNLGEYSETSGIINPNDTPQRIMSGLEVKKEITNDTQVPATVNGSSQET